MRSPFTYSKYTHMTTKKLKEILSSHYTTSDIGTDYGPVREELEAILIARESKTLEEKNFGHTSYYNEEHEEHGENTIDFTNNFDDSINPPLFPYHYDKNTEEYIPYSELDLL